MISFATDYATPSYMNSVLDRRNGQRYRRNAVDRKRREKVRLGCVMASQYPPVVDLVADNPTEQDILFPATAETWLFSSGLSRIGKSASTEMLVSQLTSDGDVWHLIGERGHWGIVRQSSRR
jgi:hypothetical protein